MKLVAVVAALILVAACGGSPTAPTPKPPPPPPPVADATLAVLVVGHVSNGPIAGVSVRLEPTVGGITTDAAQQTTGSDGIALWHVASGQRYSIHVRNQLAINAALLQGDVQWLVSLPE